MYIYCKNDTRTFQCQVSVENIAECCGCVVDAPALYLAGSGFNSSFGEWVSRLGFVLVFLNSCQDGYIQSSICNNPAIQCCLNFPAELCVFKLLNAEVLLIVQFWL